MDQSQTTSSINDTFIASIIKILGKVVNAFPQIDADELHATYTYTTYT